MHILHFFIEDVNNTLMKKFEEHECVIECFCVIDEGGDKFTHPKKNMKNMLAGDCESSIRGQRVEALFVFERLKTGFSRHGTRWK